MLKDFAVEMVKDFVPFYLGVDGTVLILCLKTLLEKLKFEVSSFRVSLVL